MTMKAGCPTPAKDGGRSWPPSMKAFPPRSSPQPCTSGLSRAGSVTSPTGSCRPCGLSSAGTGRRRPERVHHELDVSPDAGAVAAKAASYVAGRARAAVADHGRFTFAVSGGHTPWAMFAELRKEEMPWRDVVLFQVDERVAPDGDPDRNLSHLRESIGDAPAL